jgi:hypothetical protein
MPDRGRRTDRTRRSTVVSCAAGIGGLALMIAGIAVPFTVVPPGDDWCFACSVTTGIPPVPSTPPRPSSSAPVVLATTGAVPARRDLTIPTTPTTTTITADDPPPMGPASGADHDGTGSHSAGRNQNTSAPPRPKGQDGDKQRHGQQPQNGTTADRAQHAGKSPHGPHRAKV